MVIFLSLTEKLRRVFKALFSIIFSFALLPAVPCEAVNTAFSASSHSEKDVISTPDQNGCNGIERYFDPVTGRFLSPDPSRFTDSRNLYALCGHNPITGRDPDGRLTSQNRVSAYNLAFNTDVSYQGVGVNMLRPQMNDWQLGAKATYEASKVAIGAGAAVLGGLAAAPYIASAGLSGAGAAVVGGAVAGVSGDAAVQGYEMLTGERNQISGTELAVSGVLGGGLSGAGYGISKLFSPAAGGVTLKLAAGIEDGNGVVSFGGYDPATKTMYMGDAGHFGGMKAAGGTPLPAKTPGLSMMETQSEVIWANDSPSLAKALTSQEAASIQKALQARFPNKVVRQVMEVK